MNERQTPFYITNQMLAQVATVSEKLGILDRFQDLSSKPHLQKESRIQNIHASLQMESVYLPPGEVARVIHGQPLSYPNQYQQEIKKTYDLYGSLAQLDPCSLPALKRLHDLITPAFTGMPSWFRQNDVSVSRDNRFYFRAPPAQLVSGLLLELFDWMNMNQHDIHPLILASVFHSEFFQIQPFMKGNGRTARLWHTAMLAHWRPVFASLPFESQLQKSEAEYYHALALSRASGSSNAFITFILGQLGTILDEVTERLSAHDDRLSVYVQKLLAVMDYDVPYPASAIMARLHLKSKETFRKNYINPAIALGLVEMTLPDRPQSRNQQYVRL